MPLFIRARHALRSFQAARAWSSAHISPVPSGVSKRKPVPRPLRRVVRLHGVDEAAGRAHDRDGAVAQRVHLGEAAGLAARGHQEHVGPGHHLVRERPRRRRSAPRSGRGRAAARWRSPSWTPCSPVPSTTMRSGRCRKSHHAPATMSKPFCQTRREVTPTTGRSGNSGSPKRAQQVGLAGGLARRVLGRVRPRDVPVRARVPLVVVDAVQDPDHVRRRASARRRRSRSRARAPGSRGRRSGTRCSRAPRTRSRPSGS